MRKILAVAGLIAAAVLVAVAASDLVTRGISGEPYRFADCPECGRPAVFQGPDRAVRPADWSWFECDHCLLRFIRRDDGSVTVPQ